MFRLSTAFAFALWNLLAFNPISSRMLGETSEDQYTYLTTEKLSDADQQSLFAARRAVWEAWFKGDGAKIKELMPTETVVADPHDASWADRDTVIQRAKEFALTKGKLVELHFPQNRIQVYGDVVILYIDYTLSFEVDGEKSGMSGRGTEVFVKRNGKWLNTAWHLDDAK